MGRSEEELTAQNDSRPHFQQTRYDEIEAVRLAPAH